MSNLAATTNPPALRPPTGYGPVSVTFGASRRPNLRRVTRVVATTRIDCDTADVGTVQVQVSTDGSAWTTLQSQRNDFVVTGALGIGGTSRVDGSHVFDVPCGHFYRISTTANAGTPIFTLVSIMESTL